MPTEKLGKSTKINVTKDKFNTMTLRDGVTLSKDKIIMITIPNPLQDGVIMTVPKDKFRMSGRPNQLSVLTHLTDITASQDKLSASVNPNPV